MEISSGLMVEDVSRSLNVSNSSGTPVMRFATVMTASIRSQSEADMIDIASFLSTPFTLGSYAAQYLRNLCREDPCYGCSTTCVEEKFESFQLHECPTKLGNQK
mmetsp:Transcript_107244/g.301781  ORF Transcript_107244/g.301781 Transcript_107244/m.301781 type:complete len:104 (+) Transcript_107244:316-627(+)